ncbi:MAG: LysR family transcriptional regulator [Candidatus Sericytochromatia bacterium]|nr:LysR family transcriptional regulator [Candidatus Tanganyikabacteria bacterium]
MNPDWLRYFVVVAQTRNFHVAAEQLHVTPQALSKAVGALGAVLIDRDRRVRGLTAAGEALLSEAHDVLRALENAERRMAECRDGTPRGPVTIAGDGLWHHYLLPGILADLRARYPELRPRLFEMIPDDAERHVAAGEVEIGLLLRAPRRADLDHRRGLASPYVIVARPGCSGKWTDFAYVVPRLFGRELAESLDGWPEGEFPRRVAAEVELLETALRLAEAGVGAAYVPELAIRDRLARGTLAIVAEPPCSFVDQLYIVWRRGIRHTPAARALLAALETY